MLFALVSNLIKKQQQNKQTNELHVILATTCVSEK